MGSPIVAFSSADYLNQSSNSPQTEMNPIEPLTDSNKKDLEDLRTFGEMVQKFSEKLGGAHHVNPEVRFVKYFLSYYSVMLLDNVSDVEFRNSRYYFEITVNGLAEEYGKLNDAYASILEDEKIADLAQDALHEITNEGNGF